MIYTERPSDFRYDLSRLKDFVDWV